MPDVLDDRINALEDELEKLRRIKATRSNLDSALYDESNSYSAALVGELLAEVCFETDPEDEPTFGVIVGVESDPAEDEISLLIDDDSGVIYRVTVAFHSVKE